MILARAEADFYWIKVQSDSPPSPVMSVHDWLSDIACGGDQILGGIDRPDRSELRTVKKPNGGMGELAGRTTGAGLC
jgi:hypothetical protein